MTRYLFIFFVFALSSCKQEKESKVDPTPPTNRSQQRTEKQKEDLAKFVADFDEAMSAKYGRSTFPPEITGSDVFRIEGTKYFHYDFEITLHQQEQLDVLKKELHRLMNLHGVETVSFSVHPKFDVPRGEHRNFLGAWRLARDGTESRQGNSVRIEDSRGAHLFDQLRQRNLK